MLLFLLGALILAALLFYLFYRARPKKTSKTVPEKPALTFPTSYGEDEIVALVKDPYWLYAYWETTAAREEEPKKLFGQEAWESAPFAVRVHDITGLPEEAHALAPFKEVLVKGAARSAYLPASPNRTFYLLVGRKLANGTFVPLAKSSPVTTPRASFAEETDPLWPPLAALWKSIPFKPSLPSSPELPQRRA